MCSRPPLNAECSLSLNGWIYYPQDEWRLGHNEQLWRMCRAGGLIQLLERACDKAHRSLHPVPSREKAPGHGLLSWTHFGIPDVPFAPVFRASMCTLYDRNNIILFSCPQGENQFLSKNFKSILKELKELKRILKV